MLKDNEYGIIEVTREQAFSNKTSQTEATPTPHFTITLVTGSPDPEAPINR